MKEIGDSLSAYRQMINLPVDGWEICGEANDGMDAVNKVLQLKPDLAILDIQIPRTDGTATLRLIRAKYDIPVILLASKEGVVDEVFALKNGCG